MRYLAFLIIPFVIVGCAAINEVSSGYTRYVDYPVSIVSEPPGARIEWDNQFIGLTPLKIYLNDEMFMTDFVTVKAYPNDPNGFPKSKVLNPTRIPDEIYFDLR